LEILLLDLRLRFISKLNFNTDYIFFLPSLPSRAHWIWWVLGILRILGFRILGMHWLGAGSPVVCAIRLPGVH